MICGLIAHVSHDVSGAEQRGRHTRRKVREHQRLLRVIVERVLGSAPFQAISGASNLVTKPLSESSACSAMFRRVLTEPRNRCP